MRWRDGNLDYENEARRAYAARHLAGLMADGDPEQAAREFNEAIAYESRIPADILPDLYRDMGSLDLFEAQSPEQCRQANREHFRLQGEAVARGWRAQEGTT